MNETQNSDEDLMALIQQGCHGSFEVLVRRHTQMFYACAYRQCHNQEEAEDCVQEAFLKLWKNPHTWDETRGAKFTTWFYRVVVNLVISRGRRKKEYASDLAVDLAADTRASQDQALYEEQQQHALELAIQALPERQKLAVNLCFYEGLSNKEAAEIIGVRLKALESLLMRGKSAIRDHLMRQGFMDEEKNYG